MNIKLRLILISVMLIAASAFTRGAVSADLRWECGEHRSGK